MASIAKHCFLLFLLTLTSSLQIHARDSQFFNKVPSNIGANEKEVVVPNNEETLKNKQEQEPDFIPENENGGYGLYGHESGQFPPTTTTTTPTTKPVNDEPYKTTTKLPFEGEPRDSYPKYLPKNYNTESYVTEPEGYRGEFNNNNNNNNNNNDNFYNGDNSYYHNEKQGFGETKLLGKSYTTNPNNNENYNNNNNNNGASNTYYNGEQQGLSDTRFNNNNNYYNHNVGNVNGAQKKGMSDTRFLENGKYYYDINMEQNLNRGPYGSNNNRGYYGNNENSYEHNNYENQEQFQNFQDEESLP